MKQTTPETRINKIIVKKDPGTDSLFPICTLEILVLHTKIRNKELVPDSLFSINNFEVSETFTQKRNKEPVPGSRFPVADSQFHINICSFDTNLIVFIICRQITFNL